MARDLLRSVRGGQPSLSDPVRVRPVRYAAILATFGLLVVVLFRDGIVGPAVYPLQILTAEATHGLLGLIGLESARAGAVLYQPGRFAYEISRGCTGLVPIGFLTVAILAYPASRASKVSGLLLGVLVLIAVNLIRLVHLFYLGVYQREYFHLAHEGVWRLVIVLAVFAVWFAWTRWVRGHIAYRVPIIGGQPTAMSSPTAVTPVVLQDRIAGRAT